MKGCVIHQHGLNVGTRKINSYYSNYIFYEKETVINFEKDKIYGFYCPECKKYSLNYNNHDNFNYDYMVNPSNSSFIKFQDNFNLGYILLGNEIERENFIYNYFNQKIEKLKNYISRLEYEKSFFNEKKEQILKNQILLKKENLRLFNEIKTLNSKNDNNKKKFPAKINILNDKIEKKTKK